MLAVCSGDIIQDGDKIIVERTLNDGDGDYQVKEYYIVKQEDNEVALYYHNGFRETESTWHLVMMNADYSYKVDEFPDHVNMRFEELGFEKITISLNNMR